MSNLVEVTKKYIKCPHCEKGTLGTVDHLLGKKGLWTAWYCDDCGQRAGFTVMDNDVVFDPVQKPEWTFDAHILVEEIVAGEPLRFMASGVLHATTRDHKVTLEDLQNKQFWVNENTSVTNWLRVNEVWRADRRDPEGFRFLAMWGPNDIPELKQEEWEPVEDRTHDVCYLDWLAKRELTERLRDLLIGRNESPNVEKVAIDMWMSKCGEDINQWFLLAAQHTETDDDLLDQTLDTITWSRIGHFSLQYNRTTKTAQYRYSY